MSTFFLDSSDSLESPPGPASSSPEGRQERQKVSPSTQVVHQKRPRPPTPPPRSSSWRFSKRTARQPQDSAYYSSASSSPTRHHAGHQELDLRSRPQLSATTPSLKRKPKRSFLRIPAEILHLRPRSNSSSSMSSPTKTSPPTALDRGDRTNGPLGGPGTTTTSMAPPTLPMPGLSGQANGPVGNLLKGPVDDAGRLKDAALMVGVKLDLEAEVHLTARVRGDILVGLY
ncbi:hypothetical protein F4780DRAFT_379735 [Xylariomycetidae sp. FL0641]|nr:hypothetical protein F4780DRAFT_379735 [Xylariomycetidae sp. FL0641]